MAQETRPTACLSCRRRKLGCDKMFPTCTTCTKKGWDCQYDLAPKRRGPKKRDLKALESRLEDVERQLRAASGDTSDSAIAHQQHHGISIPTSRGVSRLASDICPTTTSVDNLNLTHLPNVSWSSELPSVEAATFDLQQLNGLDGLLDWNVGNFDFAGPPSYHSPFPNDVPEEAKRFELEDSFFNNVHYFMPLLHRGRYESGRKPQCLQFAIWAVGAAGNQHYRHEGEGYYKHARECLEHDEMSGSPEQYLNIAHVQTWIILSYFHVFITDNARALMCVRRAVCLCHILGLDRLDIVNATQKSILLPSMDVIELEERRRAFWAACATDKLSSGGLGCSMSVHENDIATNLPCSEEAFRTGVLETTETLANVLSNGFSQKCSYFALHIVNSHVIGMNMLHHRQGMTTKDPESIWQQHQRMDQLLSLLLNTVPEHLRVESNLFDPRTLHVNIVLNSSLVSLHLATVRTLSYGEPRLDEAVKKLYWHRCYVTANHIVDLVRMGARSSIASISHFSSYSLYVAANVFILTALDTTIYSRSRDNLNFIINVLRTIKGQNDICALCLAKLGVQMQQGPFRDLIRRDDMAASNPREGSRTPGVGSSSAEQSRSTSPMLPGLL